MRGALDLAHGSNYQRFEFKGSKFNQPPEPLNPCTLAMLTNAVCGGSQKFSNRTLSQSLNIACYNHEI
jgi:hypothetical protein